MNVNILIIVDISHTAMTQLPKFSARAFVAEKLVKELDPEGDSRTLVDNDACLLYDALYELAAREMDPDSAQRLTEGVIETVCRITLRYREMNIDFDKLMIGLQLKLKARELFMMLGRFREETASYDEEKARLLSLTKETGELLYQLVDQEFRQARKLDDALAFLGNSSTLDKLFMPNGVHSDIWSSMAENFDRLSKREILSLL